MLNIKVSYIVTLTHITLTLGGLLVFIAAEEEQMLEVKQDAESQNKLYVKLTYTDSEMLNTGSITEADYRDNCFCGNFVNQTSCAPQTADILHLAWDFGKKKTKLKREKSSTCYNQSYSFNVTTASIQVGLERNEDGDELNVILVCRNTSNHIYVNGESQQAVRARINFTMKSKKTTSNIITKVIKWIASFLTSSPDDNGIIKFYCGEMVANASLQPRTTEQAATTNQSSDSPTETISRTTLATTLMTEPTTNLNSTELPSNEQDLILIVVIPVVAVVVIIIVVIIIVVIRVRRKRKSSAPSVKYHVTPPDYNRRSAVDEESDYNILGERVPVHCDEDDYDCPYSQNTKPQKPPVKKQPEGSTYEDVDHLDLKDQLDSSPGSNNSTKPLHQPDPSQLYSVVQKDRNPEDDQGIIMVENDLYE